MALKKLAELEDEARRRWPIIELALVHRVGDLDLGEVSVVVAVSWPHRDQAFEACRWLIDTLKEVVPIWKKETWADGNEEWVHPGIGSRAGRNCGLAPMAHGCRPLYNRMSPKTHPDEPRSRPTRMTSTDSHSSTRSAASTTTCGSASPTAATSAASTACPRTVRVHAASGSS